MADGCNSRIEFKNSELALLYLEDTIACSLSVDSTDFLPTCFTNYGPSRKYEYKIFRSDSLFVCNRLIVLPAVLYYRYEDTDYIEEGIILDEKNSIEENREYDGIKYLKIKSKSR
jgi:hypothetical protein